MFKRKLHRKHKRILLCACCLFFILSVVGIFIIYHNRLNERLHSILTSGLEENTRGQKHHAEMITANIHGLFEVLEDTLVSSEFDALPETQELTMEDSHVRIDYLPAEQILSLQDSPELSESGEELFRQIMAGEDSVTNLGEPCFTDDASSFALLHPVFHDDSLTGVLRAQIDAALLVEGNLSAVSLFQTVYVILTRPDGSIVYADTPYPDGTNFLTSAVQRGIGSSEIQSIQDVFENNASMTLTFHGKGNKYYMSWESLDFNDWRIIRFARSPDVILQTETLLRGMIFTGVCLIVLTAVFCAVIIQFLLRKKHRLETQQRRYDALSQFNDTLLFEYDVIPNRVTFTPNALERLDIDARGLEGISGEYYIEHLIHPDDRDSICLRFQPSSFVLGETYYLEARFLCKNGAYSWFGCQFKSIENQENSACRIVGKLVDISEQRGREQLLRQAALADALTGVYNRSAETIINSLLEKNRHGLFFMLDLDNFKSVNDTHGHAAGDALLTGIAQILKEIFRQDDIIARIGGDEFVVFVPGTSNLKIAQYKAAAILNQLEQLYAPGTDRSVSASIGVSSAPQNGTTYDVLIRAADQAMYKVKQQAKNGFAFHENDD